MTQLKLIDFKGDYWDLMLGAIQIHKQTNIHYCHWYVLQGPHELRNYQVINTPVFTEWWS